MLVVMEASATESNVQEVIDRMMALGFDVHRSSGMTYIVLGGIGDPQRFDIAEFKLMAGVKEAIRITSRWKLAALRANPQGTRVRIGTAEIGGGKPVELRGSEAVGSILREIWESTQVRVLAAHADALVVPGGAMENESLLRELGRAGVPVILMRSSCATIDTWLTAADIVLQSGNKDIVLCEGGIRAVSGLILDIGAVAELRQLTHLPVLVAPRQVTDNPAVAEALAKAAIAAGAHGTLDL